MKGGRVDNIETPTDNGENVDDGKERTFEKFAVEEVAKHSSIDDCWVISGSNVYDVTNFISRHPGGSDLILSNAGCIITDVLDDPQLHQHSVSAYNLLKEYKVGEFQTDNECEVDELQNPVDLSGWNEDMVDWNKGLLFQVHRFGDEYLKWVFSPVDRNLRMFDSDFIEFFSRTKWYAVPMVWLPVVVLCSVFSFRELGRKQFPYSESTANVYTALWFLLLFLSGIPLWTVIEYLLHRYLFHIEPRGNSPIQITLHFFFHGLHHKVPFDEDRLVFPPAAASVFILLFWGMTNYSFPGGTGSCIFAGGLLGYVHYDLMHYYMHHGSPRRGSYLHGMKCYHVSHHFNDPSKGFGISTKFWDFPFNSVGKEKF